MDFCLEKIVQSSTYLQEFSDKYSYPNPISPFLISHHQANARTAGVSWGEGVEIVAGRQS